MPYDVTYGDKPEIALHDTCCRCQLPCECSPIGTGKVPVGPDGKLETIRNIVLCVDCLVLKDEIPKQFWYEGWPNQKKRKK